MVEKEKIKELGPEKKRHYTFAKETVELTTTAQARTLSEKTA